MENRFSSVRIVDTPSASWDVGVFYVIDNSPSWKNTFLRECWNRYIGAYEMVTLPQFFGVDGLSDCLRDCCFAAFVGGGGAGADLMIS